MIKLAHIQSVEKKLIPGSIRVAVPTKEVLLIMVLLTLQYVFVNLYNRDKAIAIINDTRENSIKTMVRLFIASFDSPN